MVLSQVYLARELIPGMQQRGWGRLLNISTVCSKEPHRWLNIILSATGRTALLGLNKSISNEFCGDGITINKVLPGLIDTGVAEIGKASWREECVNTCRLRGSPY